MASLTPAQRTRGDGQENLEPAEKGKGKIDLIPGKPSQAPTANSAPIETETSSVSSTDSRIAKFLPKGKVYNLIPKLVGNVPSSFNRPSREPRFVPFEPYKAAVTPLLPATHTKRPPKKSFNSRDSRTRGNPEVSLLSSPLPQISSLSIGERSKDLQSSDWELMYNDMRKEKEYAEKQLKFQIQVNAELKNLLIAAVGEDLHDRVNVLTEDKLTLARALLDSSNDLTSHSEQIEYLAGQCEVWRSKFLSSSLMLEELARWKTTLLEKNRHLVASNKELLKTMSDLRAMEEEMLKNLSFLVRDKSHVQLSSANALDLARESVNISQQLALINSAVGVPSDLRFDHLERLTEAEKMAQEALQITEMNLVRTDDPFRAIVSHAFPSMVALKDQRERLQRQESNTEQTLG